MDRVEGEGRAGDADDSGKACAGPAGSVRTSLLAAAGDLVIGVRCAGCGAPGLMLCGQCRGALSPTARRCLPDPCPEVLTRVSPWCAAPYADVVRSVLLAFKEQHRDGLAGPLAVLLEAAVFAAISAHRAPARGWMLVPMPSRRAATRARGYDPVALLTRLAARRLRHAGHDVRVTPALRHRRRVVDQAGLSVEERYRNLDGALRSVVSSWSPDCAVVAVDDVITTGATLAEAVLAMRAAGADVRSAAVLAATPRTRVAPDDAGPSSRL